MIVPNLEKFTKNNPVKQRELSYRKQIAPQLRTQYVEDNPVTLKCRLRVTQGHMETEPLGRSYTTY